jgi:hypothetical protein
MKFGDVGKFGKRIIKQNYIVLGFVLILILVGITTITKFFSQETAPIYIKLKVSQGLWWANTGRPPVWYLNALKVGDKQYDLLGSPIAEITRVRYYPYQKEEVNETQYDVYLTVKLEVDKSSRRGTYSFNRDSVVVGAPIELEFASAHVTGTTMEVSESLFQDEEVDAEVILTKRLAFPWEYDAIKIGDKYFDGSDNVFEITGKSTSNTSIISSDAYGSFSPRTSESLRYITIRAKLKVRSVDGRLIFGEEQEVKPGLPIFVTTPSYEIEKYLISSVRIK